MKYITKGLIFMALCCITLVLSSYTVYGHNSVNIKVYSGYDYYGQTKNYRLGNNYRRGYRDYNYNNYNYSNRKYYGINRRFNRYKPGYSYKPYKYGRHGCR